jgi:uncharacterized protein YkwD/uncharacterized protein (DUF2141 family)
MRIGHCCGKSVSSRARAKITGTTFVAAVERLEQRALLAASLPTDLEQYMVELVNRARANPAQEAANFGIGLNEGLPAGTISSAPKQPLAISPLLTTSSRTHSQRMLDTGTFSHLEPDGSDPHARMVTAGYLFSGNWVWGENIVYRSQLPDVPPPQPTLTLEHADLFVDTTVPDRGHRTNMEYPDFKEVGVGVATGTFSGYNAVMATEDFAAISGDSFLTGVAYADTVKPDHFYTPGEGLGGVNILAVRHSDNIALYTSTWSTGGYSLRLGPGVYDITASGGGLRTPISYSNVVINSQNVKLDFHPGFTDSSSQDTGSGNTSSGNTSGNTAGNTSSGQDTSTPPPTDTTTPPRVPTLPPPLLVPPPGTGLVSALPPTGSIRGRVFNDLNGNGHRNSGETGLEGETIFVDANLNGVLDTGESSTTTLADGSYSFTGFDAGDYRVAEIIPAGWRLTTRGPGYFDVTVKRHATKVKAFGNSNTTQVSGTVFNDVNANGVQDDGEAGLRRWRVFIDANNDGLFERGERSVITRRLGAWSFNNLDAGSYTIRIVQKPRFQQTTSMDDLTLDVLAGGVSPDHLVGERRLAR